MYMASMHSALLFNYQLYVAGIVDQGQCELKGLHLVERGHLPLLVWYAPPLNYGDLKCHI